MATFPRTVILAADTAAAAAAAAASEGVEAASSASPAYVPQPILLPGTILMF